MCLGEGELEGVIDCIKFLASEMMALWGDASSDRKFMNLFRLVSKRDANAAAYLTKVEECHQENRKMAVNFLSPGNVCMALATIKPMVVERIIQEIKTYEKACIIFDSTQDYSKREASVLLMRYLRPGEHAITERVGRVYHR